MQVEEDRESSRRRQREEGISNSNGEDEWKRCLEGEGNLEENEGEKEDEKEEEEEEEKEKEKTEGTDQHLKRAEFSATTKKHLKVRK